MNSWTNEIFFDSIQLKLDHNSIVCGEIKQTLSKEFHDQMPKGAALRELSNNELHQINWETPYYERVIHLYTAGLKHNLPILDLGCGDGRFTKTLLEAGFKKIVCVDSDYRLLESLHHWALENNYRENLIIFHNDADELDNFKSCCFQSVLAIGVMYYLNEVEPKTLKSIHQILLEEGVLILSEPEIEWMIYRALFFEGITDAIDIFKNKVFKEAKGDTEFKFSVKSKQEQKVFIESAGYQVKETQGITMFHNYLRILLVRGMVSESEITSQSQDLKGLFDYLHENGSLFKHIIWKCIKN
jgi:2-polyprenyl-3-methyl-5-hydroxy-6-metoxy-1,4-benzoquinol methylase